MRAEVIGTSTTKRSFLLFFAFENFMSLTQKPLLDALFKFGKQLSSFYARKLYECVYIVDLCLYSFFSLCCLQPQGWCIFFSQTGYGTILHNS